MDLVSRAKSMILSPDREWPVVASEPANISQLYQGYIIPLSAIPPLATFIGRILFGHVGFGAALLAAIVAYVLGLVAVYVVAIIAAKLAPMFGGRDDTDAGLKLVAFGSTASWVGGVFHIIPALGILHLLAALYGIYLYYTGVTPVMNVPRERAVGYLISLVIAVIVVFVVIGFIVAAIAGPGAGSMAM